MPGIRLVVGIFLGMVPLAALADPPEGNLVIPKSDLVLLQPLGSNTSFSPMPGIQIFFAYFNDIWPWVLGVAGGVAVLQALVGGIQIMMAGSPEKAGEGKSRLYWALGGMLVVAFSGLILTILNNLFFV